MSFKTQYLLDKNFARRHTFASDGGTAEAKYSYRLACNKKNPNGKKPYWDIGWRGAISIAIAELKVAHIYINEGVFFKTNDAKNAVCKRAIEIWKERETK